jgi:peptide/nickel transport system permease protein
MEPNDSPDSRVPSEPGDTHTALDLSQRKRRSTAGMVRASIVEARRAAAPYTGATRDVFRNLARSRLARLGALILAAVAAIALLADCIASDLPLACRWHGRLYVLPNLVHPAALTSDEGPITSGAREPGDWVLTAPVAWGPRRTDAEHLLSPPLRFGHPLGTDARGRDVLSRIVHGARTALGLGVGGAVVLVGIGVALGAMAGFFGGAIDALVSRTVESLTSIPTLLLVLVVGALVPRATTATLLWTVALTRWTELARLVRADVLVALGKDYVTAAWALGASPGRVLRRHVLPNAIGPAIVAGAFGVASIVLVEAAVDFLRMGAADAVPSWGETLGEARLHGSAWWLMAFPGAALFATLVALNLIGEAARDALDPSG